MSLNNLQIICSYCEKWFDPAESTHRVRSGRKPYCSAACGRLGRSKQLVLRTCSICFKDFFGNYQAKVCPNTHELKCETCGEVFEFRSRYGGKNSNKEAFYCSFDCGRNIKPKLVKSCVLCGVDFIPKTSRNKVCSGSHERSCEGCGKSFQLYPRYKPVEIDNVHPRFCSRSCIKAFTSGLEGKICQELKNKAIEFTHNDRSVISPLELDFYLPQYSLAIEVNDFFSHSKDNDAEPFVHGGFKRGPKYHNRKNRLCEEKGIKLFQLWEDEIKDPKVYECFIDSLIEQFSKTKG